MGARGPLPQSNVVRMRRANPGRGETPTRPVIADRKVPAPKSLTTAGKRLFRELVADLEPAGLFKPPDREMLAAYVGFVLLMEKALHLLLMDEEVTWADEDDGPPMPTVKGLTTYDAKNKRIARSPIWSIYSDATSKALALGLKFGITPWARLRMNLSTEVPLPGSDDGDWDDNA